MIATFFDRPREAMMQYRRYLKPGYGNPSFARSKNLARELPSFPRSSKITRDLAASRRIAGGGINHLQRSITQNDSAIRSASVRTAAQMRDGRRGVSVCADGCAVFPIRFPVFERHR
jgi:hypothetical protein